VIPKYAAGGLRRESNDTVSVGIPSVAWFLDQMMTCSERLVDMLEKLLLMRMLASFGALMLNQGDFDLRGNLQKGERGAVRSERGNCEAGVWNKGKFKIAGGNARCVVAELEEEDECRYWYLGIWIN